MPRNVQKKRGNVIPLHTGKKPKPRKSRGFALLCLGIVAITLFVLFSQLRAIYTQKTQIAELEAHLAQVRQNNADLALQLEYMQTDEYIKSVARSQLGLLLPNEVRFVEDE